MIDSQAILNAPVQTDDVEASTVREYLIELLCTLWTEEECFSGKRPFGNSGWKSDVYAGLLKAGLIEGGVAEDGYILSLDYRQAEKQVLSAIRALR